MSEPPHYPTLFSPLPLGPTTLPSRILLSAMTTGFGFEQGRPTRQLIEYLDARATDVGLVTVAFGAVRPEGRVEERIPWMWHEDIATSLGPLASAIADRGAVPCLQLGHGGRQVSRKVTGMAPVAPSAVAPQVHVREAPEELSAEAIDDIVAAFGTAAERAAAAGFRAIELHGGHGYLIQQFLSGESNQRQDRWGGDTTAERTTFATAVVRSVTVAAPDTAILVRLNGDDLVPGGMTREDARIAAGAVAEAGAHAVVVSGGVYGSVPYTIPLLDDPEMTFIDATRHVKQGVDIPVIAVGRVTTPAAAEGLLRAGDADAVAIGRGLLADPGWARKARDGAAADIRPCIATVQGCAGMLQHGAPISCAVNPDVGREGAQPLPQGRTGSVAVIGGGVAGMEAARRAAELGHQVVLLEREHHLGGALKAAANTPPLHHLARLLAWYERTLDTFDLDVRLGVEAWPAEVDAELTVIATGAATDPPPLDGYDLLPVWPIEDLLRERPSSHGGRSLPGRIVVHGAGHRGLATALWCHERGAEVVVLDHEPVGRDTSGLARRAFRDRLARAGIDIRRGSVTGLGADGVHLRHEDETWLQPAGALVLSRSLRPRPVGSGSGETVRVGDAKSPRGIPEAIFEARDAVDAFTWAIRT